MASKAFNVLCLLVALGALAVAWKAMPGQRLLPLPRWLSRELPSVHASETFRPRTHVPPAEHTVARAAAPQGPRMLDHRAGW